MLLHECNLFLHYPKLVTVNQKHKYKEEEIKFRSKNTLKEKGTMEANRLCATYKEETGRYGKTLPKHFHLQSLG